ncbi:MAG: hypothetical protein NDJ24_06130 [Alphaproteobacteria bacterium]|nr:hypothetical protein [Alphaproteobacteria bacterium]
MAYIHPDNRVDYTQHQGLWLPCDLKPGDVIRCQMLTKYDGAATAEMCPRDVMVLGFEMNPETLEYSSLHVARLSYTATYCNDEQSFLLPRYLARQGLISGIQTPAVIQIDRTDFLPLDQNHFYGDVVDVERIGNIAPEIFDEIKNALNTGITKFKTPSHYYGRSKTHWYVPSMHLAGTDTPNPHPHHSYSPLTDIDVARIHLDWATQRDPHKLDGTYITACMEKLDRAMVALARRQQWEEKNKKKVHVHEEHNFDYLNRLAASPRTAPNSEPANDHGISPEDSFSLLLPRAKADQFDALRTLTTRFDSAAQAPHFKLELPTHLWQGRYLMLRIADLHDPENDGLAYRPCAVWRAFADRDNGELVGMELHPVTRGAADKFRYKFQVHPLDGLSKNPSYLIGDCIVRVPLNERYFHEKSSQFFYELPPDKIEKFADRREHALSSDNVLTVYGLQEIPDNWVEVELDPTPSLQQFRKWSENRQLRFDGQINEDVRARERAHKHAVGKRRNRNPEI